MSFSGLTVGFPLVSLKSPPKGVFLFLPFGDPEIPEALCVDLYGCVSFLRVPPSVAVSKGNHKENHQLVGSARNTTHPYV